jgi:biopolymer transport protein ExbD
VITRPLDLLSRLRPPPRNYDFLFLVNGALIALFFTLFGSKFVLSPGLTVNSEFTMPSVPDPIKTAKATPVSVSVNAVGQIWGDTGLIAPGKLKEWLAAQAKRTPGSVLLVIMDTRASTEVLAGISETASAVGFSAVHIAEQKSREPEASAAP